MKYLALTSILCFLLSSTCSLFAQEIEWKESNKKEQKYFNNFEYVSATEYYSISSELGSTLRILHYTDNTIDSENNLKLEMNGEKYQDYYSFAVDGNLVFFFSVGKKEETKVYYQKFDKSCRPTSDPVFVIDLILDKRQSFYNVLNFSQSDNKEFISMLFEKKMPDSQPAQYNYSLYDKDMEISRKGNCTPKSDVKANFSQMIVSNDGTIILGYRCSNSQFTTNSYLSVLINETEEFSFSVAPEADDSYQGIQMKLNNGTNSLFFVGMVYSKNENSFGSFNVKYNVNSKVAAAPVKGFFGNDFLIKGRTAKEQKSYDKLAAKGKKDKFPGSYELRDSLLTSNDEIVVVYEFYRLVIIERKDTKTNMIVSTTYQYDYNDVLLAKFNSKEGFDWKQKIVKRQREVNFVYDSGIASCNNDQSIYVFFNDNIKNYSVDKEFVGDAVDISGVVSNGASGGLAMATIDIGSGDMNRKMMSLKKETKIICRPQSFQNLPLDGLMIMYAANRFSEKFGFFKY